MPVLNAGASVDDRAGLEHAGAEPPRQLADAVAAVAGSSVALERPTDPAHGDYATNVALRVAGQLRRPPREVAEELSERVKALPEVERAEVGLARPANLPDRIRPLLMLKLDAIDRKSVV